MLQRTPETWLHKNNSCLCHIDNFHHEFNTQRIEYFNMKFKPVLEKLESEIVFIDDFNIDILNLVYQLVISLIYYH